MFYAVQDKLQNTWFYLLLKALENKISYFVYLDNEILKTQLFKESTVSRKQHCECCFIDEVSIF